MASKEDLQTWVREALSAHGGRASIVEVAQHIWTHNEMALRESGDLLFTWQYDMRWAANVLRRNGVMKAVGLSSRGIWELSHR